VAFNSVGFGFIMEVFRKGFNPSPSNVRSIIMPKDLSVNMSPFPVEGIPFHEVFTSVKPNLKKTFINEVNSSALVIKTGSLHNVRIFSFSDPADELVNFSSTQPTFPRVTSPKFPCALLDGLT